MGDFNGDNKLDVITANLDGTVSVLPGNGDGTLKAAVSSPLNHQGARGIALGDFNGDGKLDAAVAADGTPPNGSDTGGVVVLLGSGNGSFRRRSRWPWRTAGRSPWLPAISTAMGSWIWPPSPPVSTGPRSRLRWPYFWARATALSAPRAPPLYRGEHSEPPWWRWGI